MFSTRWCGYCHRLKRQLERTGVRYSEIDIERDSAAASFVMQVNGGNQTVPTVLFADGSVLTNPTLAQVIDRAAATIETDIDAADAPADLTNCS